ncbi:MAG: RDD family protein [Kurthia sp.]|nr:RDD family protein [Candidatus Kurthia equi]
MTGFVANTNENAVENSPFEHKAAGFWIRFFAYLVDLLLINTVVGGLIVKNVLIFASIQHFSLFYLSLYGIITGILFYVYFTLMTMYLGQTLGKMIFGLRVVKDSGEPLDWTTVLFREWVGRFISVTITLLYLIVPFTKKHKAVHDFIADTYVIHERSYTKKSENNEKMTANSLKELYQEKEIQKSESLGLHDKD